MNNIKAEYVKFSSARAPEYRVFTSIVIKDGVRVVIKRAEDNRAHPHLASIEKSGHTLEAASRAFEVAKSRLVDDTLEMEYIEGKTLEQLLLAAADEGSYEDIRSLLHQYCELVHSMPTENVDPLEWTAYAEWFGSSRGVEPCIMLGHLDFAPSNLIRTQKNIFYSVDYEWLLDCPIPIEFVLWRSLFIMLGCHGSRFEKAISEVDIYKLAGVDSNNIQKFMSWEARIQSRIIGNPELNTMPPAYVIGRPFDPALLATLYWDEGMGFNDDNSVSRYWDGQTIELIVPLGTHAHTLRFDPCYSPCSFKLSKVEIDDERLDIGATADLVTNASWIEPDGSFVFVTIDPQVHITLSGLRALSKVRITGVCTPLDDTVQLNHLESMQSQLRESSDTQLKLREEIVNMQNELNELNLQCISLSEQSALFQQQSVQYAQERDILHQERNELHQQRDELQKSIESLYASRSWRITRPVRYLGNFFHKE